MLRAARAVLFTSFVLAGTVAAEHAFAQAPAEHAPRREVIRLRTLAYEGTPSEGDARTLEATVRELVGRLGLSVEAERATTAVEPSAAPNVLSVVTVDLTNPVGATVSVWDSSAKREVVKRAVARDRSPAIVVDEIAHIVQSSVEELADAQRTPPPAAPQEPSPAPSRVPSPAPRADAEGKKTWGLDVGAFGAGRGYSSDTSVALGGGLMLGLGLGRASKPAPETPERGPELWLSAAVFAPVDASSSLVDAHVNLFDVRAATTFEVWGNARTRFELGPEVAAELAWTRPESSALPSSRLAQTRMNASPLVGGVALARFGLASTADVFVAAMVDVDIAPHRYVLHRSGGNDAVLESWRVRPALALGVTFDVAGPGLYARDVEGARP